MLIKVKTVFTNKHRFAVTTGAMFASIREQPPLLGRMTGGNGQMVPLLAHVPDVQEIGVAGGRNLTSSLPSCTIQCGTNFFF